MGKSSCNLGILKYDGNEISLVINFRFGDGVDEKTLLLFMLDLLISVLIKSWMTIKGWLH